jgi:hypothetical protein
VRCALTHQHVDDLAAHEAARREFVRRRARASVRGAVLTNLAIDDSDDANDSIGIGRPLLFRKGDVISLTLAPRDGQWWQGELDGRIGCFVARAVTRNANDRQQQQPQESDSSTQSSAATATSPTKVPTRTAPVTSSTPTPVTAAQQQQLLISKPTNVKANREAVFAMLAAAGVDAAQVYGGAGAGDAVSTAVTSSISSVSDVGTAPRGGSSAAKSASGDRVVLRRLSDDGSALGTGKRAASTSPVAGTGSEREVSADAAAFADLSAKSAALLKAADLIQVRHRYVRARSSTNAVQGLMRERATTQAPLAALEEVMASSSAAATPSPTATPPLTDVADALTSSTSSVPTITVTPALPAAADADALRWALDGAAAAASELRACLARHPTLPSMADTRALSRINAAMGGSAATPSKATAGARLAMSGQSPTRARRKDANAAAGSSADGKKAQGRFESFLRSLGGSRVDLDAHIAQPTTTTTTTTTLSEGAVRASSTPSLRRVFGIELNRLLEHDDVPDLVLRVGDRLCDEASAGVDVFARHIDRQQRLATSDADGNVVAEREDDDDDDDERADELCEALERCVGAHVCARAHA